MGTLLLLVGVGVKRKQQQQQKPATNAVIANHHVEAGLRRQGALMSPLLGAPQGGEEDAILENTVGQSERN